MNNIDNFYSYNSINSWIKFLGNKLHYHFGIFTDPNVDPFDKAVFELFKYIPANSKVLDCGCGWGGPGKLLKEKLNCYVTGITISKTQSEFIKDFPVIHADLNFFKPHNYYDVALFIESFI
jgi:cyclopropane fatty-acyl-phospholipid synthase-like methyltransferase